jgi:Ca2+/H+ antiporter
MAWGGRLGGVTGDKLVAVILAIIITTQLAGDSESSWLEGVQLLRVYLLIAVMVFYVPTKPETVFP